MLLGGCGPGARAVVEGTARRLAIDVSNAGPLTIAAPTGTLEEGDAGNFHLWLTGRVSVRDDPETFPPGTPVANAAAMAFNRLGDVARTRIHGAYLVVVHDRALQTVRASVDHLGARTLNFARRGDDTFFAEHIVDLLMLLPATPAPDRLAVVQWLDNRTLPVGRSLFSDIVRVPAGRTLEIRGSEVAVRQFWRPAYREPVPMSRPDRSAALVDAAFAAVVRAAEGLHRPALKLSGGLDSACVAAGLAAAAEGRQVVAFGRTFPDYPETDEAGLIRQTAHTTGLELVEMPYADVALMKPVREYIRRWALPPGSPNTAIWQPLMAAARARGVDGLLDGEGGDERFGALFYLLADLLLRGRLQAAWRLAGQLPGLGARPAMSLRWRVLREYGVSGAVPRSMQNLRRRLRDPREGISSVVRDSDIPGLRAQDEQWAWKTGDGPMWWRSAVDGLVNASARLDASGEIARTALDAGVDRRHPFLHDVRLAEAALAIPPEEQFDAVRDRPLLRDGLVGAIPEAVRTRYAKSYFNEVATRPLAGQELPALLEQLESSAAPVREYVRAEGLRELANIASARGFRRHLLAGSLFRVASVDSWLRHMAGQEVSETETARIEN